MENTNEAGSESHKEHVVLVHGLFLHGIATKYLAIWLNKAGYTTSEFSYRSVLKDLDENSRLLKEHLDSIDANTVHAVGHSLGGVLIQHTYSINDIQKPGRVVALGSPFLGSKVAGYFRKHPVSAAMLGKSIASVADSEHRQWNSKHELGIIAGTSAIGLGSIFTSVLKGANDGTVAVSETLLPGRKQHITVPVSHTKLIYSQRVSQKVISFLKTGSFEGIK